jgi:hypothetical protein
MVDNFANLRGRLASVPTGLLTDQDARDVESCLASCWGDFVGADAGGMEAHKLIRRIENLRWAPPVLEFRIERHGGAVCGSTRAELQTWSVDISLKTAKIVHEGRRQLVAMDARLDVRPLAAETATMISEGCQDPRLKWSGPDRVRVLTAEVIPATNKQTTAGRRGRFVAALGKLLAPHGWRQIQAGSHTIFEKNAP